MRTAPGAEAVADDIDGRGLVREFCCYQPADSGRAPHLVIAEIERLVAVRQSDFLDALFESSQGVGDDAVGAGEVIGLLVAGTADKEGEGAVLGV